MKVLVTGGAGFIGGHLVEALVSRGMVVEVVDSFDAATGASTKRRRGERLASLPGVSVTEADICERNAMERIAQEGQFHAVAHLAALAGVRAAVEDPARYVEVDLNGTQSVLDAARATGIPHFVFASTSSVYARTDRIPFHEEDPCDRPLQPYAAAKRGAEILGHSYHHLFGLTFTALRLFTVYGPRNRPDMMLHRLARSIVDGSEVTLYQSGEGIYRDWTYVGDIVNGLVRAIERPLGFEVLNLGRGEPVELKHLVRVLSEIAGGAPNVVPAPLPSADVDRTWADIQRARHLLGYEPKVDLAEGVAAFWSWFVEKRASARTPDVGVNPGSPIPLTRRNRR